MPSSSPILPVSLSSRVFLSSSFPSAFGFLAGSLEADHRQHRPDHWHPFLFLQLSSPLSPLSFSRLLPFLSPPFLHSLLLLPFLCRSLALCKNGGGTWYFLALELITEDLSYHAPLLLHKRTLPMLSAVLSAGPASAQASTQITLLQVRVYTPFSFSCFRVRQRSASRRQTTTTESMAKRVQLGRVLLLTYPRVHNRGTESGFKVSADRDVVGQCVERAGL